jgi:hypothetical protein
MKTTLTSIGLCVLCLSGAALAQESPLGSSSKAASRYSNDYAALVKGAMPALDAAALGRTMDGVREAKAGALALHSREQIGKALDLRVRDEKETGREKEMGREVDAGDALYRFDPDSAHLRAIWRTADKPARERDAFKAEMPEIKRAHEALVAHLGVDRREVYFVDFREVLSQNDDQAKTQHGPVLAEGASSTFLRAVNGVLVEGSYARITSLDAKTLSSLDVRWPAVNLAEDVRAGKLRAPREMSEAIAKHIAAHSNKAAVNVRIAVVLRQVDAKRPGVYVPSLKIGVKPQSIKTENGYRTDAGEVFFSDLLTTSAPIVLPEAKDSPNSSGG